MTRIEKHTNYTKEHMSQFGIYKIYFTNDVKNRVYIGSALNEGNCKNKQIGFFSRWSQHLTTLISNKNKCPKLQNAFNKYGISGLKFEVIEILKIGNSNEYYELIEESYITKYDSVKNGFNVSKNGKNRKGIPCSQKIKKAISIANSGENNAMFGKFGEKHHNAKKVYQYSPNGLFVKEWTCARNIQKELGFNYKDISACCLGKKRVCRGYKWFYEYQGEKIAEFKIQNYKIRGKNRKVLPSSDIEIGIIGEFYKTV